MAEPLLKNVGVDLVMEGRYSTLEYALFRLRAATSELAIQSCARTLYCVLKEHFALEEDSNAFFSNIQELAIHRQAQIMMLRKEHHQLLRWSNRIAEEECGQNKQGELRADAERLIGAIRRHEALETQAYFDGLYGDLGGQG